MENMESERRGFLEQRIRSRLRCVMSFKGMTRKDLAESVSLSEWQVGEFFRDRPIMVSEFLDICEALSVDPSWVMFSKSFDIGRLGDE